MNSIMINRANPIPTWLTNRSVAIYMAALTIVSVAFSSQSMPWYWLMLGVTEVLGFFYGSRMLMQKWARLSPKRFERQLMIWTFVIRVCALLLFLQIYEWVNSGSGFNADDTGYYRDMAKYAASVISDGKGNVLSRIRDESGVDLSDLGYSIYMGGLSLLFGENNMEWITRGLKLIWSTWTVILMYRIALRNFGDVVGRQTAIFCMLMPNLMVYNSILLKETEMVFLAVLFVEQADDMLRTHNFSAWKVVPLLLIGFVLFTLRTPLALVAILALLFAIVMSSTRMIGWGKRLLIGALAISLIGITMGNRISEEARSLTESVTTKQQENMSWRSTRQGGNRYAKYAGAAVFAPLIFTLPFPTMVNPDGQEFQQMMNGGYYVKNILSGFVLLMMFVFLLTGDWRSHTMPIAFMLGYLVVLVFSNFAQSERFHQPILPFALMFASCGIQHVISGAKLSPKVRLGGKRQYRTWFSLWSIAVFAMLLGWNYIKLKGKGII